MQSVTIEKSKLLECLRANMKRHISEREELLADRRKKVIEELGRIAACHDDSDYQAPEKTDFPKVPDHRKEYERAIRMAEMSVSETITLSQNEFDQYIMDEWIWKRELFTLSGMYKK